MINHNLSVFLIFHGDGKMAGNIYFHSFSHFFLCKSSLSLIYYIITVSTLYYKILFIYLYLYKNIIIIFDLYIVNMFSLIVVGLSLVYVLLSGFYQFFDESHADRDP